MQSSVGDLSIQPSGDNIWHAILAFLTGIASIFQGWITWHEATVIANFICSTAGFLVCITVLWRFYWDYNARKQLRKNEVKKNARRWEKPKTTDRN